MSAISVFDILKIGVGPSSSHTLGPWRAAQRFIQKIIAENLVSQTQYLSIDLYGSLALTGKGHATDIACILGLLQYDPETISVLQINNYLAEITSKKHIIIEQKEIIFNPETAIIFNKNFLAFHPNGIKFSIYNTKNQLITSETYYSIGGGFIIQEYEENKPNILEKEYPFPIENATDLIGYCNAKNQKVFEIVFANELSQFTTDQIVDKLMRIWQTMLESMYIGCHTQGILPGGLAVKRRAYDIHQKLNTNKNYRTQDEWLWAIRKLKINRFQDIIKWISCFALAVNEVNASLGRVVTAPTNGSAGVIPAVLMYYLCFIEQEADKEQIIQFLLTAGEIGSIFKKGATISAAMGGCQAEIGVSSAMAAGALCELLGGTPEQVLSAAEIAMEHHLGLTCDPIAGLVQIPCIERNSMGAIKAINAAELALETDTKHCKVSLDTVVKTMLETAKDMNTKYKETSSGGLAVLTHLADC